MMVTVNYREDLEKAWNAGRASTLPKIEGMKIPRTFQEWCEEQSKRPTVARG